MNLQIAVLRNKKYTRDIISQSHDTILGYISLDNLKESWFQFHIYDVILIDNSDPIPEIFKAVAEYFQKHPEAGLAIVNSNYSVSKISAPLRKQLIFFSNKPLDKSSYSQILKKGNNFKQHVLHLISNSNIPVNGKNPRLVGKSRDIRNLNDFIKFIAKSANTPCLIYGEEGTEKLEVVKMIHAIGQDDLTQLRSVNCAEYNEDELIEKLFGIEYSQNGCDRNERGEIEIAEEGSLVLDNIDKMSESAQLRLLVYIETHKFRRLGSDHEFTVKTRIVASTEKNLEKLVTLGEFSRELYYHLTAFEITLPPLRQRKKDIIFLARHYIYLCNQKFGHHVSDLSPEVELKFLEYNWYGNIEELRLVIERIVLLKKTGNILITDIPSDILENKSPRVETEILGNCSLKDLEKIHIEKTLMRTKGNKSRAAAILNISRTTLREKIRTFELVH